MKAFLDELKSGLRKPVYALFSTESFLLYEAKHMVRKSLPPGTADFCFTSFEAGTPNFNLNGLFDSLKSIPFMGGRMVVVLENAEELPADELERLRKYAEKPEKENLLVVLFESKRALKGFEKTGAKIIELAVTDMEGWIERKAGEEGISLSRAVISYLMNNFNMDPGLIDSEIRKLGLLGKSHIELDDIGELAGNMAEYTAFNLVDALKRKDFRTIFRMSKLFSSQQDIILFMGALNSDYARQRLSPEKAERIFALLAETDIKMKSTGGSYPLEEFLIKLVRKMSGR